MTTASIVTYNTPTDELAKVIECLRKAPVDRLYIVDNGNEPRIRDFIEGKYTDGWAIYMPSDNVGYGAGHNKAIRAAMEGGAVYHLVANSDIYWSGPVIETIQQFMDANADVAQVMPKILYPDGSLQPHCKLIPTPTDLIFRRFLPDSLTRRRLRRFQLEFTGYDHVMNVPYLSGCFMFLRVSALREVGLFDERFFMYPEDIDLTRRLHERYRTVFLPDVSITHLYGQGSRKSLRMLYIHVTNMIRYFNKWGWLIDGKRGLYNRRLLHAEGYK